MPYKYLKDIAIADVAFEARESTLTKLFETASDAVINVMVADISAIEDKWHKVIQLENEQLDMLLYNLLMEQIFYKDAEQLLLRVKNVQITQQQYQYQLTAELYGEPMNQIKHRLLVDVKAVTLHQFTLKKQDSAWYTHIILDI